MHLLLLLQLMVAEKNGTIRFYDLTTQQAILSLESGQMPLMSADWCLKNTFRIGAVAGNDWLIWDIRSRYHQITEQDILTIFFLFTLLELLFLLCFVNQLALHVVIPLTCDLNEVNQAFINNAGISNILYISFPSESNSKSVHFFHCQAVSPDIGNN